MALRDHRTHLQAFADEHSTPLQRMYAALCLASGSGKAGFAELAAKAGLPPERAEICPGEHAQVVRAYRKLILPHVDVTRLGGMGLLDWFGTTP